MGAIFQKPPFNYQYFVGQSNLVNYRFDNTVVTAPITNVQLHTNIVIPNKTFVQDGQILHYYAAGNAGAHAGSTISLLLQLNGTTILNPSIAANATPHNWELYARMQCISFANDQVIVFADFFTGGSQASAIFTAMTTFGTRNFLNPFGGVGFGLKADNVLQMLVTDATGAETITQDTTYVYIQ